MSWPGRCASIANSAGPGPRHCSDPGPATHDKHQLRQSGGDLPQVRRQQRDLLHKWKSKFGGMVKWPREYAR